MFSITYWVSGTMARAWVVTGWVVYCDGGGKGRGEPRPLSLLDGPVIKMIFLGESSCEGHSGTPPSTAWRSNEAQPCANATRSKGGSCEGSCVEAGLPGGVLLVKNMGCINAHLHDGSGGLLGHGGLGVGVLLGHEAVASRVPVLGVAVGSGGKNRCSRH